MLARLLTAALSVGASLTAAGLTLPSNAQAHSCPKCYHKSRIHRIRIKARKVGQQTYRVVTDVPIGGTLVSGSVTPLTADGGDATTFGAPTRGRIVARGGTTAEAGSTIGVTLTAPVLDDAGRPTGPVRFVTEVIEALSFEDQTVQSEDGWIITARLTEGGRLRVEVSHANPAWGGDGLHRVDHQTDAPSLDTVSIKSVFQTWSVVATGDADAPAMLQFVDNLGQTALRHTQLPTDPASAVDGVAGYTLDQTDDGRARLTAWTRDLGGSIARLATRMVDFDMGDAIAEAVVAEPSAYQRSWTTPPVSFHDDPVDFTYSIEVQLFDAAGEPIGEREVESILPPAIEGEYNTTAVTFDDGAGQLHATHGPDGITFQVVYDGEGTPVDRATLTFQEPFEGPEPDELEWALEQIGDWSAWTTVAQHHVPKLTVIDLVPLDADGQPAGAPGYFTVSGPSPSDVASAPGLIETLQHGVPKASADDPRARRAQGIVKVTE